MSGHNKWTTIKNKKGIIDSKRNKIFTKISREITTAVKQRGEDIMYNYSLRAAIQKAKDVNMPKKNIERAISNVNNIDYEKITYEGNLGRAAFIIECITDNNNRTVSEIRSIFKRNDGAIGINGSLSYQFRRIGIFITEKENIKDTDNLILEGIEYGIENITDYDDIYAYITCRYEDFFNSQKFLEEKNIKILESRIEYSPIEKISIEEDKYEKILKFIDELESLDDVQNVYHNINIVTNNN